MKYLTFIILKTIDNWSFFISKNVNSFPVNILDIKKKKKIKYLTLKNQSPNEHYYISNFI